MQIHLAKSDITQMAVDAIVNPANSLGIMGGGVAGAISRKGGATIQREAMSLAPIAVGAAVVTNAGTLWAKHVIHAPTMDEPGQRSTIENVRRAVHAALLAAKVRGFEVIAFPGMGTGLGGVNPYEAARAMVDEIKAHKGQSPSTIWLVDLNDDTLECLDDALIAATS
jgi:O-acetyl-ADP-ribose deacetylase (regulator of RNase III)